MRPHREYIIHVSLPSGWFLDYCTYGILFQISHVEYGYYRRQRRSHCNPDLLILEGAIIEEVLFVRTCLKRSTVCSLNFVDCSCITSSRWNLVNCDTTPKLTRRSVSCTLIDFRFWTKASEYLIWQSDWPASALVSPVRYFAKVHSSYEFWKSVQPVCCWYMGCELLHVLIRNFRLHCEGICSPFYFVGLVCC
jgi:hypothetical protein